MIVYQCQKHGTEDETGAVHHGVGDEAGTGAGTAYSLHLNTITRT